MEERTRRYVLGVEWSYGKPIARVMYELKTPLITDGSGEPMKGEDLHAALLLMDDDYLTNVAQKDAQQVQACEMSMRFAAQPERGLHIVSSDTELTFDRMDKILEDWHERGVLKEKLKGARI